MRAKIYMKSNNVLLYALILSVVFFSSSHQVTAQDSTAAGNQYNAQIDSVAKVYRQQESAKDEQRKNSENLSDLKSDKKETRAKAREAQRIENDANAAARESRVAYRQEKRAQRVREQADKQAKKASKARIKSDNN